MFESVESSAEVERDRYGRYLLVHPVTGKKAPFTRATTFAKSISDTYNLSAWGDRMVVKGLTLRPDLVSLAHGLDVREDRNALNKIAEDAKSAAGNKVAANKGTALHTFTQRCDEEPATDVAELVPESALDDVRAYRAAMDAGGIRVIPELIERTTAVPEFDVAGTLDRGLDLSQCTGLDLGSNFDPSDGCEVIGDLKTGRDLQYGWNEIAIQLVTYAIGVKVSGVYDHQTKTWSAPRLVRQDFALVMHLPVGEKTCTIYRVELEPARRAMALCRDVRAWRKYRVLAEPLGMATAPRHDGVWGPDSERDRSYSAEERRSALIGPTWLERFQLASSRGELSSLFHQAVDAGVWSEVLAQAGRERLVQLEEKAG
jgi:hypothetical protein